MCYPAASFALAGLLLFSSSAPLVAQQPEPGRTEESVSEPAAESGSEPNSGGDSEKLTPEEVLAPVHESIVITATPLGPMIDFRQGEVFEKTLFSRDDQIFHLLHAGINAGQHEGGGKSLEIRRYGYNLDHGGVNGGLKILVDNVPQNHSTQGHGQGYLGSLKSLSPELVQEVQMINGPFSAEYGDFSGLGVVHMRLKETMPDVWTIRAQGGSFDNARGFFSFSPNVNRRDAIFAYEGSHTDGPFEKPLDYRRDSVTGNYTWVLSPARRFGLKWNGGRNDFNSSGQIPADRVTAGELDRFGFLSPGDGGHVVSGRLGAYFRRDFPDSSFLKVDGFIERSLFDLYSNFTFFLNDPVNGDAIQQHDSRLNEGANLQYVKPQMFRGGTATLTIGGNFLATQTDVDLRQVINRNPIALFTSAHANVASGGGYVQEEVTLANGRLQLGGGLRWDVFRFRVTDFLEPRFSGVDTASELQPKAFASFRPSLRFPAQLHWNYGRGITSLDARGVVRAPGGPFLSTTDFYQFGTKHPFHRRFSVTASFFWIDRSNELVYIPDDGSLEFAGPSRSYGYEAKTAIELTPRLRLNAGMTKVLNAFFRGTEPREFVDSAPRFTGNASLAFSDWAGWSGSVRARAINSYRLDGVDSTIRAAGHTVIDLAVSRPLTRNVEFNLAIDNLTDREFYETQNFFESRAAPGRPARERIHATPGYGITVVAGVTLRFGGK